jgi:uncharacterized membrane protein
MQEEETSGHKIIKAGERIAGHVFAIIGGILLMIIGLALGVTMVLLPVGIPIGLVGVLLFVWGMFGRFKSS